MLYNLYAAELSNPIYLILGHSGERYLADRAKLRKHSPVIDDQLKADESHNKFFVDMNFNSPQSKELFKKYALPYLEGIQNSNEREDFFSLSIIERTLLALIFDYFNIQNRTLRTFYWYTPSFKERTERFISSPDDIVNFMRMFKEDTSFTLEVGDFSKLSKFVKAFKKAHALYPEIALGIECFEIKFGDSVDISYTSFLALGKLMTLLNPRNFVLNGKVSEEHSSSLADAILESNRLRFFNGESLTGNTSNKL